MAILCPTPDLQTVVIDGPSPANQHRGRRLVASLAVALASIGLAACAGEPPEVTVDDPELVAGRAVYASNCVSCHAADGGGRAGTRLSEGAVVAAFPSIEDQIDVVADGRGSMPAYVGRLTDEQIRAVVRYTREVL